MTPSVEILQTQVVNKIRGLMNLPEPQPSTRLSYSSLFLIHPVTGKKFDCNVLIRNEAPEYFAGEFGVQEFTEDSVGDISYRSFELHTGIFMEEQKTQLADLSALESNPLELNSRIAGKWITKPLGEEDSIGFLTEVLEAEFDDERHKQMHEAIKKAFPECFTEPQPLSELPSPQV